MTFGQESLGARGALGRQIPAFVVIGSLGFCVDAGLTVLIASLGASPFLARLPAVIAATLATFLLNRAFTFIGRRGAWLQQFARYALVAAGGQALNYAVYAGALAAAGALGFAPTPGLIALCVGCGAGAAMCLTFLGFRFFAFQS